MTIEELKKAISARIKILEEPFQTIEGYNECKSFLEQNEANNALSFSKVDIWECLKCLYFIEKKTNHSFRECSDLIDGIVPSMQRATIEDIQELSDILYNLMKIDEFRFMIDYLMEPNQLLANCILLTIKDINFIRVGEDGIEEKIVVKEKLKELKRRFPNLNWRSVYQMLQEEDIFFIRLIDFMGAHKTINENIDRAEEILEGYSRRTKKAYTSIIYEDGVDIKRVLEKYHVISSFVQDITLKERNYNRDNSRELKGLLAALDMLESALKQQEIKNIREILKNVRNPELKVAFLKVINAHNQKYYDSLLAEKEQLGSNPINQFQALLSSYKIEVTAKEIEIIMQNNLESVKTMISSLQKYKLDIEILKYILMNSTEKITTQIIEWIDSGLISIDFVLGNIDLFNRNSEKRKLIESNINVLIEHGINPLIVHDNSEILLSSTEILDENLSLLESYNLIRSLKISNNLSYLLASDLEEKIIIMTEGGFAQYLVEDLNLLNSSHIKRLYITRLLNIPIEDKETLENVLNSEFFIISDDKIDEYVFNIIPWKEPIEIDIPTLLDEKKVDRWTIKLGNSLFSIDKIKTQLLREKNPFEALFFKSVLNEEEYESVLQDLVGYQKQKS